MKPSAPNTEPNPLATVSSPDLNAERLDALKQVFPDLFTNEGRRVDETAEYAKTVDATFPTSILLALREGCYPPKAG